MVACPGYPQFCLGPQQTQLECCCQASIHDPQYGMCTLCKPGETCDTSSDIPHCCH
jgi:hypothetical protein